MTAEELDLVPTDELIRALSRRAPHGLVCVSFRGRTGPADKTEGRVVIYWGGEGEPKLLADLASTEILENVLQARRDAAEGDED